MAGDAISFGPFRLLAAQRLLLEGTHTATPTTTAGFSSAVRVKRRHGLRTNGQPITLESSTICARRSTGPFRQAAMDRSRSR
jgi:hypothetical protein